MLKPEAGALLSSSWARRRQHERPDVVDEGGGGDGSISTRCGERTAGPHGRLITSTTPDEEFHQRASLGRCWRWKRRRWRWWWCRRTASRTLSFLGGERTRGSNSPCDMTLPPTCSLAHRLHEGGLFERVPSQRRRVRVARLGPSSGSASLPDYIISASEPSSKQLMGA